MSNLEAANRLLCGKLGIYSNPVANIVDSEITFPVLYADWAGAGRVVEGMRERFHLTTIIDWRIGAPLWVRLHRPAQRIDDKTKKIENYDAYAGSSTHPDFPMAAFLAACAALGIPVEGWNG